MKIIFMGTPQFSCPTLTKLIADPDFEIVAVYTREPQIAGRGHKLTNSPIHELALQHGLKVVTPKTLRSAEAQKEFADFHADAAVVVAYGLLLPQEILDAPKFGCLNIHPSLLPKWRGAAPIQRPIMEGDAETGITIIKMDKGLDSGDMICQEKFALDGSETYKNLAEKLSQMGVDILLKTLKNLRDNKVLLTKQDSSLMTYAKKIEKAECEIDWTKSAREIQRKIRALNGSLEAFFMHKDEKIKIFAAEILDENSSENEAGKILDERLSIQCGKGVIKPLILQRPGKKPMALSEFLLGFKL
ncbi:MAG: methionyl-tRNA formyltransferase [Rickettsiales bacterium]|nr:methionyl-tRNA formyltransferase [Rickettsiales bacterium]